MAAEAALEELTVLLGPSAGAAVRAGAAEAALALSGDPEGRRLLAALGRHRTAVRARLRRAGRTTSTSRPAACRQNKHLLQQRRKSVCLIDKAVGVALPTHDVSSIFPSLGRV